LGDRVQEGGRTRRQVRQLARGLADGLTLCLSVGLTLCKPQFERDPNARLERDSDTDAEWKRNAHASDERDADAHPGTVRDPDAGRRRDADAHTGRVWDPDAGPRRDADSHTGRVWDPDAGPRRDSDAHTGRVWDPNAGLRRDPDARHGSDPDTRPEPGHVVRGERPFLERGWDALQLHRHGRGSGGSDCHRLRRDRSLHEL
jgi:hypothetical protein